MHDISKCPIRKALQVLGGKWTMLILMNLAEPKRYGELKKLLPDISEKVLIQKLRYLEKNAIIKRKDFQEIPPKVLYSITRLGGKALSFIPGLEEIGKKLI